MTPPQKQACVLFFSQFFFAVREDDRYLLDWVMRELLDADEALPDRVLVLRAIDRTWSAQARPAGASQVHAFFVERPEVADRPGAYGV